MYNDVPTRIIEKDSQMSKRIMNHEKESIVKKGIRSQKDDKEILRASSGIWEPYVAQLKETI